MKNSSRLLITLVIYTYTLACSAQRVGSEGLYVGGTQADYDRAASLRQRTAGKVFGETVEPHWLADNTKLWFKSQTSPDTHEYILVDAEKGTRQAAFDHDKLADALNDAGLEDVRVDRLPLEKLRFDFSERTMQFHIRGKVWQCDLNTYALTDQGDAPEESLPNLQGRRAPRVSGGQGRPVNLTFENRTENEVQLFWVDTAGRRQRYGTLKPGGQRRQHTYGEHVWLVADPNGEPVAVYRAGNDNAKALIGVETPGNDRPEPRLRRRGRPRGQSPDGQWTALIKDHNVYLKSDTDEFQLTDDGAEANGYTDRMYFSPDSSELVVLRRKKGEEHKVYFVESSPADQIQPRLHSIDYHKPGDVIDTERPYLFDLKTHKEIPVSNELFFNPYQLFDMRWSPDSSRFMFVYNQRGHQVLRVVAVDAKTGKASAVVDETSETFICYSQKYFCEFLDDTGEIIWMSERDGWNHLYLYDAKSGNVKNQITQGEWVVRKVERVDAENRRLWLTVSGCRPGQDPYYIHYARVNFDGTDFTLLTDGNGTHTVQFSPNREFIVDTYSRVDMPPVHELRRTSDGKKVCDLQAADWRALLATDWRTPEPFVAKGRDGKTDIYGIIIRPSNFDAKEIYPVIEDIYAGPHDSFVPKRFSAYYNMQSLAELGFIVVKIDGMGTSNRSKAFHDVCWKNLVDAGFPDRIAWMKAAAKKYRYMDITRVGIYGGSAGGQNAAGAVLTHGDFYKAAIADCGCHDNRMDKIWWNEQWMGWPVGPEYESNSNVTLAKNLTGKLMLIVGEMDRNVDPASTMQVVDALIKADRDFDLLVIPGGGHGAGGSVYGRRRQADFFVRHLLGVEPRSQ